MRAIWPLLNSSSVMISCLDLCQLCVDPGPLPLEHHRANARYAATIYIQLTSLFRHPRVVSKSAQIDIGQCPFIAAHVIYQLVDHGNMLMECRHSHAPVAKSCRVTHFKLLSANASIAALHALIWSVVA